MDEGDEEEVVDLDDSFACFVEEGVPGASEIEDRIGVGCEGPFHLELEELDTSTLGNVETRGTGVTVSSDLVHIEGVVGDVRGDVFRGGS